MGQITCRTLHVFRWIPIFTNSKYNENSRDLFGNFRYCHNHEINSQRNVVRNVSANGPAPLGDETSAGQWCQIGHDRWRVEIGNGNVKMIITLSLHSVVKL